MPKTIGELFPILEEFVDDYKETIQLGINHIQDKTIGILGLARNIEPKINYVSEFIQKLSAVVKTQTFIYENDSHDNTPHILKILKSDTFNYTSEQHFSKQYGQTKQKERTNQLSEYRNQCLEYARKNFLNTDYILVIDTDFVVSSVDGILHSLGNMQKNKNINATCGFSYQIKQCTPHAEKQPWNYDCWAYRSNWWEDLDKIQPHYNPMLWFGLWVPPIGSKPIPINSGFGGSCLYKTKDYLKGKYEGYDCEHVCFNKNLKNTVKNFQLYANPAQLTILDILA